MLRKPRYIIPLAITGFWLVMVALFIHREGGFTAPPRSVDANWTFTPQDQWMGIFLEGGGRVGRLHWVTEASERDGVPGYTLDLDATLETSLFGMTTRMDIEGQAWTAEGGEHAVFDFSLDSSGHQMGIEGTLADKRLRAILRTGGESVPLDFPMEQNLLAGSGIGMPGSGIPALEPGQSIEIDAFDPTTMRMNKATVARVGEETLSIAGSDVPTSVYTTTVGGMTSRAWIGPDDEVVQASTPFGFTLRKIAPEDAETPVAIAGEDDMIRSVAIFPTGPAVHIDATRLTVRIAGVDLETIPHDPPWQLREGELLTILQPTPLPDGPASNPPAFDPAPFLESDAFVTADHPEIIVQAQAIVGEESDSWKRAVGIHTWLYDNIEKIPVLSVPSALDVLRNRTGDCNEHAVLFAALARSLDIPTRIAIGLVYSDTLGGFGYHAWPEVYYGGVWYSMDPTLGQVAADATHIKLLNGSIEAWVRLAAYIGQIELEIVTIE